MSRAPSLCPTSRILFSAQRTEIHESKLSSANCDDALDANRHAPTTNHIHGQRARTAGREGPPQRIRGQTKRQPPCSPRHAFHTPEHKPLSCFRPSPPTHAAGAVCRLAGARTGRLRETQANRIRHLAARGSHFVSRVATRALRISHLWTHNWPLACGISRLLTGICKLAPVHGPVVKSCEFM